MSPVDNGNNGTTTTTKAKGQPKKLKKMNSKLNVVSNVSSAGIGDSILGVAGGGIENENAMQEKDWGFQNEAQCDVCGMSNKDLFGLLMQCAKCKNAYFCSSECYKKGIEPHRERCTTATRLMARNPMGTKEVLDLIDDDILPDIKKEWVDLGLDQKKKKQVEMEVTTGINKGKTLPQVNVPVPKSSATNNRNRNWDMPDNKVKKKSKEMENTNATLNSKNDLYEDYDDDDDDDDGEDGVKKTKDDRVKMKIKNDDNATIIDAATPPTSNTNNSGFDTDGSDDNVGDKLKKKKSLANKVAIVDTDDEGEDELEGAEKNKKDKTNKKKKSNTEEQAKKSKKEKKQKKKKKDKIGDTPKDKKQSKLGRQLSVSSLQEVRTTKRDMLTDFYSSHDRRDKDGIGIDAEDRVDDNMDDGTDNDDTTGFDEGNEDDVKEILITSVPGYNTSRQDNDPTVAVQHQLQQFDAKGVDASGDEDAVFLGSKNRAVAIEIQKEQERLVDGTVERSNKDDQEIKKLNNSIIQEDPVQVHCQQKVLHFTGNDNVEQGISKQLDKIKLSGSRKFKDKMDDDNVHDVSKSEEPKPGGAGGDQHDSTDSDRLGSKYNISVPVLQDSEEGKRRQYSASVKNADVKIIPDNVKKYSGKQFQVVDHERHNQDFRLSAIGSFPDDKAVVDLGYRKLLKPANNRNKADNIEKEHGSERPSWASKNCGNVIADNSAISSLSDIVDSGSGLEVRRKLDSYNGNINAQHQRSKSSQQDNQIDSQLPLVRTGNTIGEVQHTNLEWDGRGQRTSRDGARHPFRINLRSASERFQSTHQNRNDSAIPASSEHNQNAPLWNTRRQLGTNQDASIEFGSNNNSKHGVNEPDAASASQMLVSSSAKIGSKSDKNKIDQSGGCNFGMKRGTISDPIPSDDGNSTLRLRRVEQENENKKFGWEPEWATSKARIMGQQTMKIGATPLPALNEATSLSSKGGKDVDTQEGTLNHAVHNINSENDDSREGYKDNQAQAAAAVGRSFDLKRGTGQKVEELNTVEDDTKKKVVLRQVVQENDPKNFASKEPVWAKSKVRQRWKDTIQLVTAALPTSAEGSMTSRLSVSTDKDCLVQIGSDVSIGNEHSESADAANATSATTDIKTKTNAGTEENETRPVQLGGRNFVSRTYVEPQRSEGEHIKVVLRPVVKENQTKAYTWEPEWAKARARLRWNQALDMMTSSASRLSSKNEMNGLQRPGSEVTSGQEHSQSSASATTMSDRKSTQDHTSENQAKQPPGKNFGMSAARLRWKETLAVVTSLEPTEIRQLTKKSKEEVTARPISTAIESETELNRCTKLATDSKIAISKATESSTDSSLRTSESKEKIALGDSSRSYRDLLRPTEKPDDERNIKQTEVAYSKPVWARSVSLRQTAKGMHLLEGGEKQLKSIKTNESHQTENSEEKQTTLPVPISIVNDNNESFLGSKLDRNLNRAKSDASESIKDKSLGGAVSRDHVAPKGYNHGYRDVLRSTCNPLGLKNDPAEGTKIS